MKKAFAVLAVILIVMAVSCSAMLRSAAEDPDSRPIPDPALVKDGVYRGVEETPLVKAEVSVTVRNHRITAIDIIRHECGTGKKAEAIIDEMVRLNTSEAELVSGATLSSKVIRAAVRNALASGLI